MGASSGSDGTSAGPGATSMAPQTGGQDGGTTEGGGASASASASADGSSTADPPPSTTTSSGPAESSGSTEPPPEEVLEWPAVVAECVLLPNGNPYGDPAQCEQVVSGQHGLGQGLMAVDVALNDNGGGGRAGVIYLRFDWPPEVVGTVLELDLMLTVYRGDGRNTTTGDLWTAEPFEAGDLDGPPPPTELEMLFGSIGNAPPGSTVTWTLDPADFPLAQPVYLRLEEPVSNAGIAYWNLDAPSQADRPTLRVRYQP